MPRVRGAQEFTLPEGATLKQLVEKGLSMSHAGVGTVVRLRKELSLVKGVPVLIAIDDVSISSTYRFNGSALNAPCTRLKVTCLKFQYGKSGVK